MAARDRYASQHKEWFSRAFLAAVAGAAGYPVQWTLGSEDLDGVDATVRDGGVTVDFQLKATSKPIFARDGEKLLFDLDVDTYQKLNGVRSSPAYLLLVTLPENKAKWIHIAQSEMIVRYRSFWIEITGMPNTKNRTKTRIALPVSNILTESCLIEIMDSARRRLVE